MWSLFSRDPTKDFAFDVGEIIPGLEEQSIWKLHEGKRKANGEVVSVFAFDIKNSSESQVLLAKASFKKIKTLRHPNILTFLDGLETEKVLYIVTEHVIPLETYLKQNETKGKQNELAISWGLHQIVKGLSFLTNDCNFIHNNVCMASVFADKAGEWKLSGMDYMYPASGPDSYPPVKILPALDKYDPPEKTGGGRKPSEKWSADMWGLGCLIWEVFNGSLPKTSSLKSLGKMPKSLVPNYGELVSANPKSRPNPAKFIDSCKSKGGFMDNKFVETMLFLEEIQIKESNEKNQFFNTLAPVLDNFPDTFCKHKILPQLIHAFEYGNAGSGILTPLFKLGKLLETEEYQKRIVPCVIKLFSSTDRTTRVKLLQQIELFVEHLTPQVVNDQIYPNVVTGFMDSNPVVREHTIKSMLQLACKLNYKNLNEDLLKHFARLQSKDDQGGIRTNTTVCLGKIACHMNPQVRQKVLPSAYLRATKDPFPPARQAGILAMTATHNFFSLRESSGRLVPALCPLTMDPDKGVRDQAFKAIKCYLGKLEKASENPELIVDIEKDVNTGGSAAANTSGWTGWAMSGMTSITSKIYKGTGTVPVKKASVKTTSKSSSRASSEEPTLPKAEPSKAEESLGNLQSNTPPPSVTEESNDDSKDDGGWDADNWGDMEDMSEEKTSVTEPVVGDTDGWDDEDWGSIEDTTLSSANHTARSSGHGGSLAVCGDESPWGAVDFSPVDDQGVSAASSYNWGTQSSAQDDFFSTVLSENQPASKKNLRPSSASSSTSSTRSQSKTSSPPATKPTKPASVIKASPPGNKPGVGWEGSGWGEDSGWADTASTDQDWNTNEWQSLEDQGASKAELARKRREEKKLQRQKEVEERRAARQGGGAMKLGAKKLG